MQRTDLAGRIVGLIVFLAGIAILAVVFVIAYGFFTSQSSMIPIPSAKAGGATATASLGVEAVRMLARILSLIVMAIVGSIVASKGIHLYFEASGGRASGPRGNAPES